MKLYNSIRMRSHRCIRRSKATAHNMSSHFYRNSRNTYTYIDIVVYKWSVFSILLLYLIPCRSSKHSSLSTDISLPRHKHTIIERPCIALVRTCALPLNSRRVYVLTLISHCTCHSLYNFAKRNILILWYVLLLKVVKPKQKTKHTHTPINCYWNAIIVP